MIRILAASVLVVFAGLWIVGSQLTQPTPAAMALPDGNGRPVSISSSATVTLGGTYWAPPTFGASAILLLHGNGADRTQMNALSAVLREEGYGVLAIDFRGHGRSTPLSKSFGLFEADDAAAALSWLRRCSPGSRIGIIGFSLGGAASLLGRNGPLEADALVLEGVYPDIRHAIRNRIATRLGAFAAWLIEPLLSFQSLPRFGVWPSQIAPIRAATRLHSPVMVVGGAADTNTPPEETRALYRSINAPKQLLILPGIGHDELGRTVPEALSLPLLAFLNRHLRP
ncbi:alpha/beta fold hydrolase [Novosphingobium sp.]|uniref:alpha/beta hydrolase n=1 Tax=Novosphingobium sp. TaxID=1874826 RepID=UPI002625C915|nr:alpha/beta fold hydrolase [Novosphingobium sp.]